MPARRKGTAAIFLALMLLVVPIRWVLAAVVASAFHELCHIVAVYCCGGEILAFSADHRGARLEMGALPLGKQLLCWIAGPAGGILLCCLHGAFPRVAICALVQTVYNLLPIEPMDGGRILHCLCRLFLPPGAADRICHWARTGCFFLLGAAFSFCFFVLRMGLLGALPLLMALIRGISEKDLAKKPTRQYNREKHPTKEQNYEGIAATDPARCSKTGAVHRRRI